MASNIELPFQPIRGSLYEGKELWVGFDSNDPDSLKTTTDFKCYQYFVKNGRATTVNQLAGMMEALHDNSILRALYKYVNKKMNIVGIMGGHRMERNSKEYRLTVKLAQELSQNGFLLVSGGGPGAMEATHLGTLLKSATNSEVNNVISMLSKQPKLPEGIDKVVSDKGVVSDVLARALHEWAKPAHAVLGLLSKLKDHGESLAIRCV